MTADDIRLARVLMEDMTVPLGEIANKFQVCVKALRRSVNRTSSGPPIPPRSPGRKSPRGH